MQECQVDVQEVEQVLENTTVYGIDGDGVERKQNFLPPVLLMEANLQVMVQDYDVYRDVRGLVQKHC